MSVALNEVHIPEKTLRSMYVYLMKDYKESKKVIEELQNEINKLKNKNTELKDRCEVNRVNANQHAYLANKRKQIIEEKDKEIELLEKENTVLCEEIKKLNSQLTTERQRISISLAAFAREIEARLCPWLDRSIIYTLDPSKDPSKKSADNFP